MFKNMYEFFGLNPFYSSTLAELLRGSESSGCVSGPSYVFFGFIMLLSVGLVYSLMYHIIDSPKFSGIKWWWVFGGLTVVFNLIFPSAYLLKFVGGRWEVFECAEEFISIIASADVWMFGVDNAIWSLVLFALLSCPPLLRKLSKNCYTTTAFTN
jgi:hypothetical protein